ncbi:PREDICTED: uncharacterized protein LOC106741969 isoform X2 [Dinoponera quadriceps]|uniref:Uncharacterized protein LOC106741969 isoform X2 n=1 Tax=Dinoponera quadriceps TaxID=609295 RepID=A0A6P3WV12_DINQU|nr:PREDICTED: uncharacterized protein LOC106741969 isoform X2 [Dinoponera quadriceps]
MRCILAVAFAVILIAAEGKVLPASNVESQQTATQPLQLSDYITEAQNAISNVGTQIREKLAELNLPDNEQFVNTVKEQSNTFANNIQQFMHNITEEVKSKTPELESFVESLKTKMNEIAESVTVNPETTEQINQLRTRLQEGFQNLVTETQNTAKTVGESTGKLQEDIAKITKNAIDIAVQASHNLNEQLQHAATQNAGA